MIGIPRYWYVRYGIVGKVKQPVILIRVNVSKG